MMNSLQSTIDAEEKQFLTVWDNFEQQIESFFVFNGAKMVRIDGPTPSENRQKFVDRFQNDAQVEVALLPS